jgi:N-acyl-D-aspartate/D-glutamate deacylase
MAFRITVIDRAGAVPRTYTAIGNRDALLDAAYDAGALGVTLTAA